MSVKEPQFWPFSIPLCGESEIRTCDFLLQRHGAEEEMEF